MSATATLPRIPHVRIADREVLDLGNGDRVDQPTFHRWYTEIGDDINVELIDGEIFVASPVFVRHARLDSNVHLCLGTYESRTAGVAACANGTFILSEESEPQPDSALFVLQEFGGRTKVVDDYCVGGPELVVEVARSARGIELHRKKTDYERAGVLEYLVLTRRENRVRWHVLVNDKFQEIDLPEDGILRSRVYPGLWLNVPALFALDAAALVATLHLGLADPEHATFVQRLQAQQAALKFDS